MTIDRRQMLLAGAAALAAPAAARAQTPPDEILRSFYDNFFQQQLERSPETATNLGLDTGRNAHLRSKLSDGSPAGIAAAKRQTAEQLQRLREWRESPLPPEERLHYDVITYTREASLTLADFPYGTGGSTPYVISQQQGAYQSTPEFLDTKHPIANDADCEAYLSRLRGFATLMDQNTEIQARDAGLGVAPPAFILGKAIVQMEALLKPAAQSQLVQSLVRRAAEKGLSARHGEAAAGLYQDFVIPALTRQLEQTRRLQASTPAGREAGVRRLPRGEEFYAKALAVQTTTRMTPAEVHQMGQDQAREISARIDTLLKARGLSQGTVGARIRALYNDPASFFANTDAGKVELIDYCNERQAAIVPRLSRFFKAMPPYRFEVRRVPPSIEAGAASAYAQGPSLDGSRPGLVFINLADTAEWPRWSLASVTYHEGLPGHQFEVGLGLANQTLPMLRKTSGFAAYSEGWGLYAEQLADELGMYDDDPMSRIGYLRFQLFRAVRCIADTGIHALGWSRERAIQEFVEVDGDAPGFAAREVERYCVGPGQACSYKIGHTVWTRARDRAKAALGARYDIRDFHEAGLACGRVPLDVLDAVIDRYVAAKRA